MQDFSGGVQLIILGDFEYTCRVAVVAREVWGHAPKIFFKNDAISCVLRAIFTHFHFKKFCEKIKNKQEFFTDHGSMYDFLGGAGGNFLGG